MSSFTEENYLKAIFKLQERNGEIVANLDLARKVGVQAATVTNMLQKMATRDLIVYEKSKGVKLTEKGRQVAVETIRRHRLWEVFLVEKLGFGWESVHDIAEQLEHIQSGELIDRLDAYLQHPKSDPHGDPIPDANGVFAKSKSIVLARMKKDQRGTFTGVVDHSPSFLDYLDRIGLALGDSIKVKAVEDFDHTYLIGVKEEQEITVSNKVANSLLITRE